MEVNPYLSPAAVGTTTRPEVDGYRPTRLLVPAVSFLLGVQVVAQLVAAAITVRFGSSTEAASLLEAEPLFLAVMGVTGLAMLVTSILLPILFLVWIYRVNGNARALGAKGLEFTEGWCVAWFFIPFFNFFKPYAAVQEIYQASEPGGDALDWVLTPRSWLIRFWWMSWVVSGIATALTSRIDPGSGASSFQLLCLLATAAAAALAMGVVWAIHRRQEEKLDVVRT